MTKYQRYLNVTTLILVVWFAAFAFLRFYLLHRRITFDWDQEQFSTQIWELVKDHKPTLLGPRVTDDLGFFLAPYFTYLLVPFYLVTMLHPYALGIFMIVVDIVFFSAAYTIISRLFGKSTALAFLAFWIFNAFMVKYDAIPWWPLLLPLGVILAWWALSQVSQDGSYKNYIVLAAVEGLFIHMHFQYVLMILCSGICLIVHKRRQLLREIPQLLTAGVVFVSFWLPLLLFDLRHDFLNSQLMYKYFFQGPTARSVDPHVWTEVFAIVLEPLTYWKSVNSMWGVYIIVLVALGYLVWKKREFRRSFYIATLVIWCLFPLIFAKYGRRPSEYYFMVVIPGMYLALADTVTTLAARYQTFVIVAIAVYMSLLNYQKSIPLLEQQPFALHEKDRVVRNLKQIVNGRAFNVSFSGPPNADTGFRYLMQWYGLKPTNAAGIPLVRISIPEYKAGGTIYYTNTGYKIDLPKEWKQ